MTDSSNDFASDHLRAHYQSGIAAFFAFVQPAFKSAEAVIALNLQATRAALAENEATLKSALQIASPGELFTHHVSASQQATAKALSYGRELFDIATHAQAEFTHAVQAQTQAQHERAKGFAERFSQNAPAGFTPYFPAFNSAFAAFGNAAETFRHLAQQTVESARKQFDSQVNSITAKAFQQPATQEAAIIQAAK